MQTVQLTIGHNVAGSHRWSVQNVTAAVALALEVEAFTAIPCYGMWRGEAEESTRIEICGLDDAEATRIRKAVPALAELLEQEAIMCRVEAADVEFVEPAAVELVKSEAVAANA